MLRQESRSAFLLSSQHTALGKIVSNIRGMGLHRIRRIAFQVRPGWILEALCLYTAHLGAIYRQTPGKVIHFTVVNNGFRLCARNGAVNISAQTDNAVIQHKPCLFCLQSGPGCRPLIWGARYCMALTP